MGSAPNYLVVSSSLVQVRLAADLAGGLVNLAGRLSLQLTDCNISGYFSAGSKVGALVSVVLEVIQVQVVNAALCSNVPDYAGQGGNLAQYDSTIAVNCDLCGNLHFVYGICQAGLINGELNGHTLVCKNTFVFDGEKCSCPEGYTLNVSSCVNILEIVDSANLQKQIDLKANASNVQASVQSINSQINQLNTELMTSVN